jgi:uncharacterized protein YjiS (DUF1127 family)
MAIDIQLNDRAPGRPGGIAALLRTFRQALQHRQVETELDGLSDRQLRDIGVERAEISEKVARDMTRVSLAGLGWPNRPRRG